MKVYVCESSWNYEGDDIRRVYDTREKGDKWVADCYNLKAEWSAYCQDWEEQNNPSHGYTTKTSWSTAIAKYYSDEFRKLDSDREADSFSCREYEVI